jgi:diguanylate cyclase
VLIVMHSDLNHEAGGGGSGPATPPSPATSGGRSRPLSVAASTPRPGESAPERPACVEAALDRLVTGCAAVPHELVVVLLSDRAAGGFQSARVGHADDRRAVVLQARLRAELRALNRARSRGPGETGPQAGARRPVGDALPVDAAALPEPVRAVLAEGRPGPVLVVPVCGRDSALGVLVVAGGGPSFTDQQFDALLALARDCGSEIENAFLSADSLRAATLEAMLTDAVVAVDRSDVVTRWNSAAEQVYGIPAAEAVGRPLHDLLRTRYERGDALTARASALGQGRWSGRVRQTARGGTMIDIDSRVAAMRGGNGEFLGLVAVNRDVTGEVREKAVAQELSSVAQDLMDALDASSAVIDRAGRVVSANLRWQGGVLAQDRCVCGPVAIGENWLEALRSAPGRPEPGALAAEVGQLLRGRRNRVHLDCSCDPPGPGVETGMEVIRLDAAAGGAVVVQTMGGGDRRRPLTDDLTFRATHDELTGLPNRAALMEGLAGSLRRLDGQSRTGGKAKLAVLFCDLDGFKDINDGLGHAVGDQVLVAVAQRLRRRCRSADVVARFGGDEFVVVLSIDEVAQAVAMADRIVELLDEPIRVGEAEVAPGVSVGITVVDVPPDDEDPVGTLLRDADTAMYHAKGRGRGRYELFDSSLRENIEERLELAAALHRAVGDGELELVYQARRYCGDRRVAGIEALLRWRHPDFGVLQPNLFIPIAERTGRIVDLGEWALRQALLDLASLDDCRITLAVNVSPRQLVGSRLVHSVAEALALAGVTPSRLTLEITENAFVDDPEATRAVLTELRALGVTVALDDFGTGWSSLQYLRTLPVDMLKIDRSFVADLPTDADACAVVSAVLNLGHGMGMVVVAEGVESEEQLTMLRDMGCDEYQGFLDDGPAPLTDLLISS